MKRSPIEYISLILLGLSAIVLIALQLDIWGWLLLLIGAITLFFCTRRFRKDIALIYLSLGILGLTPITTNLSVSHMLIMATMLTLAIVIPYCVSRYLYKDYLVRFRWHHGRNWYKTEIFYVFITATLTYLFLPFMLYSSGSYHNWTVEPGVIPLLSLFIGTNGLGLWDELFFISTVLGILRKHVSFPVANLLQSILFTSFLYELGFRDLATVVIFIFALVQGYVFKKTESLIYVITIHLTLDLILYFALIHAHHPEWMPIFLITGR